MKIYKLCLIAIVSIFLMSCDDENVTQSDKIVSWSMTKYRPELSQIILNPGDVTWSLNKTSGMLNIINNVEPEVPYYSGEYPFNMTTDTLIFTYEGDSKVFRVTPYQGELIVFIDPDPNAFDDGIIFHFVEE